MESRHEIDAAPLIESFEAVDALGSSIRCSAYWYADISFGEGLLQRRQRIGAGAYDAAWGVPCNPDGMVASMRKTGEKIHISRHYNRPDRLGKNDSI